MAQMGFGVKWRLWVHGCLSTAKVSVLVNGSPTKEFMMEKGVRQGDPMAPFLFLLAAEGLKLAMDEAINKGLFRGISLPKQGPTISILQYADDAIFLGEWSRSNAMNLGRILKCFHLASGLKVNLQKSKVKGIGVNSVEVKTMARRMKCKDGSFPFSYLGMPVGAKMSKIDSWLPLVDKFQSKLSSWKAKNLSFGGRLILCKSVLGSLGLYLFSLYKAPKRVIKILESIRARFFWGGADRTKISWVAWNATLNSKDHGGLGIGSLRALNLALLGKWWWRFKTDTEGLWHEVVSSLFGPNGGLVSRRGRGYSGGSWGTIRKLNKETSAYNIMLHDLFSFDMQNRSWSWNLESDGRFSVSSLRRAIDDSTLTVLEHSTRWNHLVPGKVNLLLWRARLGRLPTKLNLIRRGVGLNSDSCPLCHSAPESEDHLFLNCSTSKEIRAMISSWCIKFPFSAGSLSDLLDTTEAGNSTNTKSPILGAVIAAYFWAIWQLRNSLVFNKKGSPTTIITSEVMSNSFSWVKNRTRKGVTVNWDKWRCNPLDLA